jgi:hypothetical protein
MGNPNSVTINIPLGKQTPGQPPPNVLPVQLSLNTDGTYGGTATISAKGASFSIGINYNLQNNLVNFTANERLTGPSRI